MKYTRSLKKSLPFWRQNPECSRRSFSHLHPLETRDEINPHLCGHSWSKSYPPLFSIWIQTRSFLYSLLLLSKVRSKRTMLKQKQYFTCKTVFTLNFLNYLELLPIFLSRMQSRLSVDNVNVKTSIFYLYIGWELRKHCKWQGNKSRTIITLKCNVRRSLTPLWGTAFQQIIWKQFRLWSVIHY